MTRKKSIFFFAYLAAVAILLFCARSRLNYIVSSESSPSYLSWTEGLANEIILEQAFVPTENKLNSIDICVDMADKQLSGELKAILTDVKGEKISETSVPLSKLPSFGWCSLPIEADVEIGKTYRLQITAANISDGGPKIAFAVSVLSAPAETIESRLSYNGMDLSGFSLRINFNYQRKLPLYAYAAYFFFAAVMWLIVVNNIPALSKQESQNTQAA